MAHAEPAFSVGIEEEYWLVDKETRNLASDPPADLVERCNAAACAEVSPEFLKSQIEIGTNPLRNGQIRNMQTRTGITRWRKNYRLWSGVC